MNSGRSPALLQLHRSCPAILAGHDDTPASRRRTNSIANLVTGRGLFAAARQRSRTRGLSRELLRHGSRTSGHGIGRHRPVTPMVTPTAWHYDVRHGTRQVPFPRSSNHQHAYARFWQAKDQQPCQIRARWDRNSRSLTGSQGYAERGLEAGQRPSTLYKRHELRAFARRGLHAPYRATVWLTARRRRPAIKKRVYELARELGVPDRVVHDAMDDLGYRVISAATPMTDEEIQAVKSRLGVGPAKPIEPDSNG